VPNRNDTPNERTVPACRCGSATGAASNLRVGG
jgi:hypothetical protein